MDVPNTLLGVISSYKKLQEVKCVKGGHTKLEQRTCLKKGSTSGITVNSLHRGLNDLFSFSA